ncbi:MAG: hypothetical protein KJ000_00305 [Pirellulaceae bacterium]|nr:hypothetical protein [Pirellulaceae bacterium]
MFKRPVTTCDSSAEPQWLRLLLVLAAVLCAGCGTTRTRTATEQLLMSDAVDRSIEQIDFSPLRGRRIFFDTQYLNTIKGLGFVNSDYLISSLRQQMLAAGCLLEEKADTAEYIVEGRCGALGTDGHEVTYGMPASTGLSNAASVLPNVPTIPLIPEISVARREDNRAAAKIGVFAYHRETRLPVWQSGVTVSTSNAKDVWVFGAGPFQSGSIYDGTQFAGSRIRLPLTHDDEEPAHHAPVSYFQEHDFERERRMAERRRRQTLESIERLADIPELMPLTQSAFESSSGPRRLPAAEESAPVSVASKPEPANAASRPEPANAASKPEQEKAAPTPTPTPTAKPEGEDAAAPAAEGEAAKKASESDDASSEPTVLR